MEPVEVKPKRWFLARWWAAIWSWLVEPDPCAGPRAPLWTITDDDVARLPKHLEDGARYLTECGALKPDRVMGRNCIALEMTPATAREVADRLRARAEADAARGVYSPPPAPVPAELASNPLDTKTPSYFELAAWYRELWAEVARWRDAAQSWEQVSTVSAGLKDEASAAAATLRAALEQLLAVSRCKNGCPPDDLTCATNVADQALSENGGKAFLDRLHDAEGLAVQADQEAAAMKMRALAAEAELAKTLAILHDAETTPASGWALELAAAKENGQGVAAVLEETEAGAAAMREALERFEPSWGDGVVDATDGARLREEGRAAALATTAGKEFLERYRAAVARGDRAEARLRECGWSVSPDGALTDLQGAGLLERTPEGFRIVGGVPPAELPSGLTKAVLVAALNWFDSRELEVEDEGRSWGQRALYDAVQEWIRRGPDPKRAITAARHGLQMREVDQVEMRARREMVATANLPAITSDPRVFGGKPSLRGMRLSVEHVLGMMAAGDSLDDLIKAYPKLQRGDVLACLSFARAAVAHVTASTIMERNRCARIARTLNPGDEGPAGFAHGQAIAQAIETGGAA